jgi:hypothetical protein
VNSNLNLLVEAIEALDRHLEAVEALMYEVAGERAFEPFDEQLHDAAMDLIYAASEAVEGLAPRARGLISSGRNFWRSIERGSRNERQDHQDQFVIFKATFVSSSSRSSPAASNLGTAGRTNNDPHWICNLYSGLGCAVRVSR